MTLSVTLDSSVKLWTDCKYRMGKIGKETVVYQFSLLARHMPGGTEETHEIAVVMVGTPSKLEMWTSRTHVSSAAPCSTAIGRTQTRNSEYHM